MPWCRFVLALGVFAFFWASSSSAILIEMGSERIGGYLVSDDGKKLSIRVQTKDGEEKKIDYLHTKIKILHQLDVKRLEALSKDNPKAYQDYADELAGQDGDPEAKYMARRLYLIAASLDPQKLGGTSLLRLSELAGTTAEARKCRALAFLLDPKADPSLLTIKDVKPAQPAKAQVYALQDFAKAMQYYRTGRVTLAIETANRKGVDKIFNLAPGDMDQKSFRRMCADANCTTCKTKGKVVCATCSGKGVTPGMFGGIERCASCSGKKTTTCETCFGRGINHDLSDDTLRLILRAELWATEQLTGGEATDDKKKNDADKKWSSVLQRRQLGPVLPLSLDTITEFEPRKCHYRKGSWVVPSEKAG